MLQPALAMRTTTLRLGTAVIVLPWHNPVLLAEQAATLDLISGGRLDFGIGKGYRHSEFAGFRIPPEEAEPRFEEAVEVMTKAFYVARALLAPRPILAVRRHRGRAAAGAAAASAVLGRGRQRSFDPPSRPARLQSHPRSVCFAAATRSAHRALPCRTDGQRLASNRCRSRWPAKLYVAKTGPMRKPRWPGRPPDNSEPSTCRARQTARPALMSWPTRTRRRDRGQCAVRNAGRDLRASSRRCNRRRRICRPDDSWRQGATAAIRARDHAGVPGCADTARASRT